MMKEASPDVAVFPPMCLIKRNIVNATRLRSMTAASGARFPSLNPVVKEKTVMAMLRIIAIPVLIIFPSFPGNLFAVS